MRRSLRRNKTDNFGYLSEEKNPATRRRSRTTRPSLLNLDKSATYRSGALSRSTRNSEFTNENGFIDFKKARSTLTRSDCVQAVTSMGLLALGTMTTPITEVRGYGILAAGAISALSMVDIYATNRNLPAGQASGSKALKSMASKPAMLLGADFMSAASAELQGSLAAGSTFIIGAMLTSTGIAGPIQQLVLRRQLDVAKGQQEYAHRIDSELPH